jgi:hypothetical protein
MEVYGAPEQKMICKLPFSGAGNHFLQTTLRPDQQIGRPQGVQTAEKYLL